MLTLVLVTDDHTSFFQKSGMTFSSQMVAVPWMTNTEGCKSILEHTRQLRGD